MIWQTNRLENWSNFIEFLLQVVVAKKVASIKHVFDLFDPDEPTCRCPKPGPENKDGVAYPTTQELLILFEYGCCLFTSCESDLPSDMHLAPSSQSAPSDAPWVV